MITSPKLFAFVLMPFDDSYTDIYKLGIKSACELTDIYCERVDEQVFQETILQRVYNQISKADVIIADMSGRNPNVFYEVGYAHALGKFTILLTNRADDIPFDLKHFQHIVYENKISNLKDELHKKLLWYVNNPRQSKQKNQVLFEMFMGEHNLLESEVTYICARNKLPWIKLTLHNLTPYTLSPGSFQLGIITPNKYKSPRSKNINTVNLPDKSFLHMLPYSENLFPDSFASFSIIFDHSPNEGENERFTVRLFSELGTFDFPVNIGKGKEEESRIVSVRRTI